MRTPQRRTRVDEMENDPRAHEPRREDVDEVRGEPGDPRWAASDPMADEERTRAAARVPDVPVAGNGMDGGHAALLPERELDELRARWSEIQGRFVDEPRAAVEAADALVSTAAQRIAQSFSDERAQLERQWERSGEGEVSTEDLRQTLQRYRSFFDRLLSI